MGKCASAPEEVKPIYDIATESCGSPSTPKSRSKSRNSPRTQDADAITWIRGYSAAQESNQSIVQLDEIDDVDREETRSQIAIEPNLQFGDVAPIPQLQAGDETGFIFLQTSVSNSRRSLTGRSAQSPQGTPTMKLNTSNASLRHQTSNSVSSTWKFNLSPYAMKSRSALFEADEPSASQLCEDDDIYIPPDEEMTFGDEVELSADLNSLRGIIRFFGHVPLRKGESFNPMNSSFYGIQLFKPRGSDDVVFFRKKCNKMNGFPQTQNSGLFGEIRYFECGPNEGWFVRKEQIARVLKVNYDNPRVSCGIPIYLKQFDSMGIIRYVGRPEIEPKSDRSTQNNTKYGIELLDFNGFRRSKTDEMDRNPGSCPDANPDAIRESERDSDRAPNRESDENPNPDPYPDPDSFQFTDGTLCGQKCFHCVSDYGVFLEASDLSVFVQPSRYNLLVHGYILMKCRESMRIPSGIIRLIQSYGDQMQLRLTGIIEITPSDAALGERVLKYESFNICNNICGMISSLYSLW